MKVSITDAKTLSTLRPADVAAYLRTTGWTEIARVSGRYATWAASRFEVMLPLQIGFHDFPQRMAEVVGALAARESRSQLQVLADLRRASADIVRFRVVRADEGDPTVPLENGAHLAPAIREIALAAACSAIEPKPVYHSSKPAKALEYLRHARLGQTEPGSYIVTLLSRVAPAIQTTMFVSDEPFERKVVGRLATGLEAIQAAATISAATQDVQPFRDGVTAGVSANLCLALASLAQDDGLRELDVSVGWARSRPASARYPTSIRFSSDLLPIIGEAGRVLKETSPREDFEARGIVVALARERTKAGRITVWSDVEGAMRKVAMELDPESYSVAIEAHHKRTPVVVMGELRKEGRGYILKQPREFRRDLESVSDEAD